MNIKDALQNLFGDIRKKQNHIPEEDLNKILSEVEKRVENEPPPRIAFIGETGVGKSSTLNALFNAGLDVSHTQACTQEEQTIEISASTIEGLKGVLVFYDMPGLGESRATSGKHLATYERILKDVDVAFWILEAHDRAIEYVQERLANEIKTFNSNLVDRMVFALNKVDLVYPGETDWHPLANLPSIEQEQNINARIQDVHQKIVEAVPTWEGTIVGYSANKRYNLPQLFAAMLDAVPQKRQWVVASRKALADYLEFVDARLLDSIGVQKPVSQDTTQEQKISDIVKQMTQDEFAEISKSKESLETWLSKKFGNQ